MSTGLRAGTNNDGYLQVSGTDVLTALSSGRIGVGTDNPSSIFDVEIGTGSGINFDNDGVNSPTLNFMAGSARLESAAQILVGENNGGGDFIIKTKNTSGTLTTRVTVNNAGVVKLPDGGKFVAGDGDDLQIYHDGSNSYIDDAGTGNLILGAANFQLMNVAHNENHITATDNAQVELYHNGSKKLETTTTGAKLTGALEVTQEYPTIRPTLDLNFAATKTLDRRITFTRDSIGTYIDENRLVKYASNNVPRFDHDPTTGESLGLLIEESRTNILGLSSDLTDNNGNDWDAVNGTIAVNQTGAPDGTTTAASFTTTAGNAEHSVVFAELVPIGNVTASLWVKTNTYSIVSFVLYGEANSTVSYNLSTATVYNQGSNVSRATIKEYPNGWYRISATMNCTVAASRAFRLYASTGNFDAGGSESFYYWGPQVEAGNFETSYIPTFDSNTSVTRAQDTPLITGTNFTDFYNQSEGTLVLSADIGYLATSNQAAVAFEDTSNVSATFIAMGYNTGGGGSGTAGAWYNSSGTTSAFAAHNIGITINTEFKQAYAYKLNDFSSVANGSTPITDTSGGLTSLIDRVRFGIYHYDGMTSGHIRQFKYYNKRLSNSQLQGLTQQ